MKRWAEGKSKAYIYTRYGNPSLAIAEGKIAAGKDSRLVFETPQNQGEVVPVHRIVRTLTIGTGSQIMLVSILLASELD